MIHRTIKSRLLAIGAAVVLVGMIPTAMTSAQVEPSVTTVSIKGSIGAGRNGWKVFLVDRNGKTRIANVNSSGAFEFNRLRPLSIKKSTLHVIDNANRYIGPIVLAKEKIGAAWCAHQQLSGEQIVGARFTKIGRGFVAANSIGSSKYMRAASKATVSGVPVGAASGGIVTLRSSDQQACNATRLGKTASISAMVGEELVGLGDDTDDDGLPNAFDADDDGDRIIDASDATTANTTAAMNPWVALRSSDYSFNANLDPNLSEEEIVATLGASDNYVIQFFVGNRNLFPNGRDEGFDVDATINDIKWVYVDCGELVYCGGESPTAIDGMTHDQSMGNSTLWSTYQGGWAVENGGSQSLTLDPDADFGIVPEDEHIGNALWAMNRANGPERIFWRASVFPDQGADTLSTVRPGDVFTLNFSLNGAINSLAMMLNPHAVTIPGLKTVNSNSYEGGAISTDNNDKVAFSVYRPQRLVSGAEVGGGAGNKFMDLGGMQYGLSLSIMGRNSFSCPAASYTELGNVTRQTGLPVGVGWPLLDQTTTDSASSASNSTVDFTLNVRACVQAADEEWSSNYWGSTSPFNFELAAAGTQLTGGANNSALQLTIVTAPN